MIPSSSAVAKGVVFGIAAWLGMMVMVMPMAGAGPLGMAMGIMAPMMTLVLHVIFGAVGDLYFADISVPPALYAAMACPICTPCFAGEDILRIA